MKLEIYLSSNNCNNIYSNLKFGQIYRGVFRTESNIFNEAFLQKKLTAKSQDLFLQKSFIVDVRLSSKYASDLVGILEAVQNSVR